MPREPEKPLSQLSSSILGGLKVQEAEDRLGAPEAMMLAVQLFRCSPAINAPDPQAVVEATATKFLSYPRAVVEAVVRNFPMTQKHPTTLADVVKALEASQDAAYYKQLRDRQYADQMRRRREDEQRVPVPDASKVAVDAVAAAFKREVQNKKSPEEVQAEAQEKLAAGLRDGRWNTEKNPVKISPYLRKYLDHMAEGGTGDEFRQGYKPGSRS
jgi:hypothetical protein